MMGWNVQVSKNSTVRKNDYNIVNNPKENETVEFDSSSRNERALSGGCLHSIVKYSRSKVLIMTSNAS